MADFEAQNSTPITDNRFVQYQPIAEPIQFTQTVAPTFFAASAPVSFPPRYPQHPQPFIPPFFQTLPAPAVTADAYFVDRFPARYPEHQQPFQPPVFETLPSPAYGPATYAPSRLDRALALSPYPQAVMNIDPITAPAPTYSWRAYHPDRLERARALGDYPQPVMNVSPIPNVVVVPDFISALFPSGLRGFPPPEPPQPVLPPTPTNFLVLDDYSRGLHVGDIRGFYQTMESARCEPWAVFNSENAQSIPNAAYTTLNAFTVPSRSGFTTPAPDLDPWDMVELSTDRITFKYDGYYVVAVNGGWENNSTGARRVRVQLFLSTGVLQRVVIEDIRAANFTSFVAMCSDVQPFGAGQYIMADVFQSSGGPLLTNSFFVSILRVARKRTVTPLPS